LNTEGYSRQSLDISANTMIPIGNTYLGTGSTLNQITRAYNGFVETNLRDTSSDLYNQQPVIDYGNRVIDIFGSPTSGLTSSLDRFYEASATLSTDPASVPQRNIFLTEAESLASSFQSLSGHLDDIDQESQLDINLQLSTLNNLTQQLVEVNAQLARKPSLDQQPPELLDQRDNLLRELSELVKIDVNERASGGVEVRLDSSTGTVLVNQLTSAKFTASFSENDPGAAKIFANVHGSSSETLSVTGGLLGGLINFRSQILAPAVTALDHLAVTVNAEINAIQTTGVDLNGERGTALFEIDPNTGGAAGFNIILTDPSKVAAAGLLRITNGDANTGSASLDYLAIPTGAATPAVTLTYDDVAGTFTDSSGGVYTPDVKGLFSVGAITFELRGVPATGDTFEIGLNTNAAGDNRNMALMVQLQNKSVMPNGNSISAGYAEIVNGAGNRVSLAVISQDAMQAIYDQAIQAKGMVSGVNLDQEASDLIRFQQAYQASAQIIKTASELFDAILAVR
ncbi:MAG: flagellar hook-associated protein FlgK, partial [Sinobacterium sp.]